MLGSERLLLNGEGALVEGHGLLVPAARTERVGEVVEAGRDRGIFGSEDLLPDREGASLEPLRVRIPSQVGGQDGHVAERPRKTRVVRPEALGLLQRRGVGSLRLGEAARGVGLLAGIHGRFPCRRRSGRRGPSGRAAHQERGERDGEDRGAGRAPKAPGGRARPRSGFSGHLFLPEPRAASAPRVRRPGPGRSVPAKRGTSPRTPRTEVSRSTRCSCARATRVPLPPFPT